MIKPQLEKISYRPFLQKEYKKGEKAQKPKINLKSTAYLLLRQRLHII